MLGAEQFKETILDILEEERWTVRPARDLQRQSHDAGRSARLCAGTLRVRPELSPVADQLAGNCPILEVRQYLIENAFVEEVRDPTITTALTRAWSTSGRARPRSQLHL